MDQELIMMQKRYDSEEDEKDESEKDEDEEDEDEGSVHSKHVTVRSKDTAF